MYKGSEIVRCDLGLKLEIKVAGLYGSRCFETKFGGEKKTKQPRQKKIAAYAITP
jgi:hypothetical protein